MARSLNACSRFYTYIEVIDEKGGCTRTISNMRTVERETYT